VLLYYALFPNPVLTRCIPEFQT